MDLKIIEQSDSLTHVALIGSLDIEGTQQVELKFNAATAAQKQATIVDISGLEFIASMGMGMLLSSAQALKREGCIEEIGHALACYRSWLERQCLSQGRPAGVHEQRK